MAKTTAPLLPATAERLHQLGGRLQLARLRRKLTAKQVAERAGMAPMTLRSLERGGAGVTMGAYLAVMHVLGLERDLDLLAQADPQGRALQDARLPQRSPEPMASPAYAHHVAESASALYAVPSAASTPAKPSPRKASRAAGHGTPTLAQGGFVSARALAGLLDIPATPAAKKAR